MISNIGDEGMPLIVSVPDHLQLGSREGPISIIWRCMDAFDRIASLLQDNFKAWFQLF